MARKRRILSPTGIYHWIIRGINKKPIFHSEEDFRFVKLLFYQYKSAYDLDIYHYCLMHNHAHLLIQAKDTLEPLIHFSSMVLRKYAYHYCKTHKWSGSVFQRGYKSIPVDKETYLLECARYIERNPLKAFLVSSPEEYRHSSYNFYKYGVPDSLVTASPAYLALDPLEDIRRRIYANYVETNRIQEEELLKPGKSNPSLSR